MLSIACINFRSLASSNGMCSKIPQDGVLVDLLDGYLQTSLLDGSYHFDGKYRINSVVEEVSGCRQPVALPEDQTKCGFQGNLCGCRGFPPTVMYYRIYLPG